MILCHWTDRMFNNLIKCVKWKWHIYSQFLDFMVEKIGIENYLIKVACKFERHVLKYHDW